jgi:RNA polymerase sigma-70 factor (ECF subfamily)
MNATLNPTNDKTELIRLVVRAQRGDREAFGELYVRFEKHVLAIALRRLGNYGQAQELTQDVFIQAMKKLKQLRVPAAFPGWLRSIANRMAINQLVRRDADLPLEQEALEATYVERDTPLAMALAAERKTSVRKGLAKLGRLDRQTLVAFYVKGMTIDEMAGDFDAPEGTIKRRLHVARKRLAKQVAELAV